MARKNFNLIEMNKNQDEYLPKRMLTENNKPPNCPGLPGTVNLALELLFEIPIVWYPY
jgi:hypothetical protein